MAGEFNSDKQITLRNVVLPEMRHDIVLPELHARLFAAPCRYDIILGQDALRHFKVNPCFADDMIESSLCRIPMRAFPTDISSPAEIATQLHLDYMDPLWSDTCNDDAYALACPSDNKANKPEILPSNYEPVNLKDIADSCTHLSQPQRNQLHELSVEHQNVFDGKLRSYTDEPIHLEVDPNATPHRCRAYPIARSQLQSFKNELD